MKSIIRQWDTFLSEGIAQKYRFDTAVDVITDEALDALKR